MVESSDFNKGTKHKTKTMGYKAKAKNSGFKAKAIAET